MLNIAIISPSQNAYSETFIQAHMHIPDVTIKYYYGSEVPENLDGIGKIIPKNKINRLYNRAHLLIANTELSVNELLLAKSLRQNKVQVVIAEYGTVGVKMLPVCKYCKIPLVVYFRGFDASIKDVIKQYQKGYIDLFQYAAKIMCVSNPIIEKLKELGCPAEKLMFHSSAPNMNYYKIQPKFKISQFIGIGRFVDKKAPYYTILAFSKVVKKHPDAELIIGGDGPLLNVCKNLIRYLQITQNVQLPGVISPEQFAKLLENSLAFVQHSITADNGDSEGTPLAILEAGAASIPVISTRHAGIPYAVIHNQTGFLVDEHDVDEMAKMMCIMIEEPDIARKFGSAARERMLKHFNLEERLNSLSEVIHNLVCQKANI
jgi:colanic acid/amylovoran biosynthesis glycosyltransferase